jgi:hypothetical protein
MSKKYLVKCEDYVIMLNKHLIREKNISDETLNNIKRVHHEKLFLFTEMDKTDNVETLRSYAKMITKLEFELQELWCFPKDIKFHKFWELPKCKCPKMDNDDAWGSGYYIVSGQCPIHGGCKNNS